jgi:regulation of enolase protein 1 (concanavalin A-like superfamily)
MDYKTYFDETFKSEKIPADFTWYNPPKQFKVGSGLEVTANPETDFWQRTHYGFSKDNGHALLTKFKGDFTITTHCRFNPNTQYDQCGLLIRENTENWVKVSVEYEDNVISRLGSVVTNMGYSDWATQDILSSIQEKWLRLHKHGNDVMIEHSDNNHHWKQMRIAHLHHSNRELKIGVYACSPKGNGFPCTFQALHITDCQWNQ